MPEGLGHYLNNFQRTIVAEMLRENAQLIGWNSRKGKVMLEYATEITLSIPGTERGMYQQAAHDIAVRTL